MMVLKLFNNWKTDVDTGLLISGVDTVSRLLISGVDTVSRVNKKYLLILI